MGYYSIVGAVARMFPAESAHNAALCALKSGLVPSVAPVLHDNLRSRVWDIDFPNPVGLAAGFDKNAEAVDALLSQGFGFIEVGTVTPLQQSGNTKPRLFRLPEDGAVINRFGFNSMGVHAFAVNLKKRRKSGIIGANISKNKDSLDAIYDYATSLAVVYDLVDYITVNISSPNTVGLRDLQQKQALDGLMKTIEHERTRLAAASGKRKPILYKIAPDLTQQDKEDIVEVAFSNNIDGLIISNTTISRKGLQSSYRNERGGLSGKPLFGISTETLRDIYRLSQGRIPIIGAGGISTAGDAYAKIKAGASLLQLYTALVYGGFEVVRDINQGLSAMLERDGFKNIRDAVGQET